MGTTVFSLMDVIVSTTEDISTISILPTEDRDTMDSMYTMYPIHTMDSMDTMDSIDTITSMDLTDTVIMLETTITSTTPAMNTSSIEKHMCDFCDSSPS